MIELLGQWRHRENLNTYSVFGIGNARARRQDWVTAVFYRADATGDLYAQETLECEWLARFERVKS